MGAYHQMRMQRAAWPRAEHIAGLIYVNVLKAKIRKEALQFFSTRVLMKRRRGNFADSNLLFDGLRFNSLGNIESSLYGRLVQERGWILGTARTDYWKQKYHRFPMHPKRHSHCSHCTAVGCSVFDRGNRVHSLPEELDMFVEGFFENPLLIAMRAEALWAVF